MSIIEPVRKDVQHPQEIKRNSSAQRLWHWLNMLVISGSLLTVLLNSTLLKSRTDMPVIKNALQDAGAVVTDAQVKAAAHDLSDSVWAIHTYFGYGLVTLLLFRIGLEFFQLADQKFMRKFKSAWHHYHQIKRNREIALHEFAVKLIYLVFYLLLVIMTVTGLFLAFEDFFAPYKAIRPSVKDVHGFCMYLILAFIAVHVIGVYLAERKASKGIVSDMINGGRQ